jgi:hypothetical protein
VIKEASIKQGKDGFKASVTYSDGRTVGETFDDFADANVWLMDIEEEDSDTPELAASETSVEQAEAINSNVNAAPHPAGATAADIHAEQ